MNEQLIEKMKIYHASNFSFYLKSHFFHWNVEGPNFPQYHSLFEKVYTDAWEAADDIAEHIRALESYAPGSFIRFSSLSVISDQIDPVPAPEMISLLMADNVKLMLMIGDLDKIANNFGEIGLSNFLQSRYEIHKKHQWMLRATSKVM